MLAEQSELFDPDQFLNRIDPFDAHSRRAIEQEADDYRQLLETEALVESKARGYGRVYEEHVRAAAEMLRFDEYPDESRDCGLLSAAGFTLVGAGGSSVVTTLLMDPIPMLVLVGCFLVLVAGTAISAYAFGIGRD